MPSLRALAFVLSCASLAACAVGTDGPSDAAPDQSLPDAAPADGASPDAPAPPLDASPSPDAAPPADATPAPDAAPSPDAAPDAAPAEPTYDSLLALTAGCARIAGSPLYATDDGEPDTVPLCQLNGAVYWHSDMDVDCDGVTTAQCSLRTDPAYQPETSIEASTGGYLNAAQLPYVVVPLPRAGFNYGTAGLHLGSVAAVLYNGRLVYAVFGDEGPSNIIGEGSYALAQALGIDPDPSTGGTDSGVTFIVFTGASGVLARPEDHALATSVGTTRARELLAAN